MAATPGTHVERWGAGAANGGRLTANGVPDKSVGRTTAMATATATATAMADGEWASEEGWEVPGPVANDATPGTHVERWGLERLTAEG
jgi:hypothetical protein